MKSAIFGFLFAMWALILIGGGIVVTILGPISITGFGDFDWIINSGIKSCSCNNFSCDLDFDFIKIQKLDFQKRN